MATLSTHGVNPAVYKNLPYDPIKNFAPVTELVKAPGILVVNAALPVKDFAQFVAYLKANPDKLSYASPGNGTIGHLSLEMLKSMAKIDMLHIPYKGASPAVTAVMQGEVDVQIMNLGNIAEYVKNGNFRLIGAASARRSNLLPDLPTIAESGVAGYSTGSWWGLFGPAGLPAPLAAKIRAAVTKALDSEDVRKILQTSTIQRVDLAPEQLPRFVAEDLENWGRQIKAAGIKPE